LLIVPPVLHSFPTRRSSDLSVLPPVATPAPTTGQARIVTPPVKPALTASPIPSSLSQPQTVRYNVEWRNCGAGDTWENLSKQYGSEEHTSELQSHLNLVCRL